MNLLRDYDIIYGPIVTEKSTASSVHSQMTFLVDCQTNKYEIRKAVERLFDVEVLSVNVMNYRGKHKRFRGRPGHRRATKKAIVTLREGYVIDVTAGI